MLGISAAAYIVENNNKKSLNDEFSLAFNLVHTRHVAPQTMIKEDRDPYARLTTNNLFYTLSQIIQVSAHVKWL